MNLANTAPGRAPWGGPEWGISEWSMSEWLATAPAASAALSLQLSFDAPPQPHGWSWVSAPWDSSRHGAELAALLVSLQPVETCFLPVTEGPEPPHFEAAPAFPPPLFGARGPGLRAGCRNAPCFGRPSPAGMADSLIRYQPPRGRISWTEGAQIV
jgi:hypothetical protein